MKISYRIFLLIIIIILLNGIVNFWLTRHQAEVLNYDSEQLLVRTLVQSLREALVQDVIDGNKLRVNALLRKIKGKETPVEFLYVTDSAHKIFAHSFEQGFPVYLAQQNYRGLKRTGVQLTHKYQTKDGLVFVYAEALIPGLGAALHIGVNQTNITRTLAKSTQDVLLISLLSMAVALLLSFYLSKKITRPLSLLTEQIKRFASGEPVNFSQLGKVDYEIRQLSASFQKAASEREQALTQLQEREQNLAITLDSIGDAVITTDATGKVTRMNPVAEQLTGWLLEDAVGLTVKTIFPIINADTGVEIANPVEKVVATGETVYLSNHTTLIAKDGTRYHIADSAAPIRDQNEKVLGMVLIFHDETEQYQLREEIRKRSQQVISILDSVTDAYVSLDKDESVIYINAETERMLNTKMASLKGRNFWQTFPGLTQAFYKKLTDAVNNKVRVKFEAYYSVTGQWLEVNAYPDEDQLNIYFRDISKRKEIDEKLKSHRELLELQVKERTIELEKKAAELERATRLKSEFLANMSHELRTPMNSIIGFTARVIKKGSDKLEPRQLKNLHTVERNALHLLGLINGLLDLSKIEAGKMDVHAESFDFVFLAGEVFRLTQPMLENKAVKLLTDMPADEIQLYTDSTKLKQIMINLVSNAIKFTESGSITISAEVSVEDGIQIIAIRVSDTGVGMNEEALKYIFDAFRQVDGTLTRKTGGTGLGLAIVSSFTDLLHGTVNVNSEEGVGTQFEIKLPVNINGEDNFVNESLQAHIEKYRNDDTKNLVLCIDDDAESLDLLHGYLTEEGYSVLRAQSGEEGLRLAKQYRPTAITLDILMPGKDGWSVISELKASELTHDIPVIIISFLDNRSLGYQLGAYDYMQKPISPSYLVDSLGRLTPNSVHKALVVDDDPEARDLICQILEDAKVNCATAQDGLDALSVLKHPKNSLPDLILLDLMMPGMDGFDFLREVSKSPEWAAIPVIVITAKTLEVHEREFLKPRVANILEKEGLDSGKVLSQLGVTMRLFKENDSQ